MTSEPAEPAEPAAPAEPASPGPAPVLVTGAGGMLGRDLAAVLIGRPDVDLRDRAALDVLDPPAVDEAVAALARRGPGAVVLNAAAWTDVDGAEADEEAARRVNGTAVEHLADACARHGARLVHVSTDYVLSGRGPHPLREDAPTAPVNAYGRGKLAGERAVLGRLPQSGWVVRTEWLYGAHGRSFVRTMARLASSGSGPLDVVDDQTGQPTSTSDLARALVALTDRLATPGAPAPGVLHATARGATSWFGLAREVLSLAGADPGRVRPVCSAAFPRPARRPSWSVLAHERWDAAGLPPLPHWREALRAQWAGLVEGWPEVDVAGERSRHAASAV